MVNEITSPGDVVLVTGGCGFVGTHIMRLLVERGTNIQEIRIYDIKPPKEDFVFDVYPISVTYIQGDVRDIDTLRRTCRGVDAVIHTAAALDTSLHPDMDLMHSINVKGTGNVIQVCKEESIEFLIHTSSSEVKRVFSERRNITETEVDNTNVASPSDLALPAYSMTKKEGENLVLEANGSELSNGKKLKALSLRPCGIYGEGDQKYVTGAIRAGSQIKIMPIIGPKDAKMQRVYVGNVAWAHVHALNVLRYEAGRKIDGLAYHITDNTAESSNMVWMKPYLEMHQICVPSFEVPLSLVYYICLLTEMFIFLLSPLAKITLPATRFEIFVGCTSATYDGTRAKDVLGYHPLYPAGEAYQRSALYYSKLKV